MTNHIVRIRTKVLLPIGLGFCVLVIIGFSATFFIQKKALDNNIGNRITNARVLFKELLKVEAELLASFTSSYKETKELQSAFLAGDRDNLLAVALPLFNGIKTRNKITHFYFHRLDKTCFLRVHNPTRHGDKISRFTLDQAVRTEAPAYGIELGPLGTLTFRLVQPWVVDGKLIGYIELGKEIDQITPIFKHMLNLEIIFTVQKKHLDHKLWAEGELMLNKPGSWEQFSDFVVVSSTFRRISASLGQEISRHFASHEKGLFSITQDDKIYRSGAIPLIDAAGIEVGDIFVFANYNKVTATRNLFIIVVLFSALGLMIFYTLLTLHIGRIERDLQSSTNALEEERTRHQKSASGYQEHSEADLSQNYCPECARKLHSEQQKN